MKISKKTTTAGLWEKRGKGDEELELPIGILQDDTAILQKIYCFRPRVRYVLARGHIALLLITVFLPYNKGQLKETENVIERGVICPCLVRTFKIGKYLHFARTFKNDTSRTRHYRAFFL